MSHGTIYEARDAGTHACHCVGPQNGQPLCPCQMRNVQIVDGRYVQITDLGPARGGLIGEASPLGNPNIRGAS